MRLSYRRRRLNSNLELQTLQSDSPSLVPKATEGIVYEPTLIATGNCSCIIADGDERHGQATEYAIMPYDQETTHCLTMEAGSVFSWLWVDEERNCFSHRLDCIERLVCWPCERSVDAMGLA